jgi:hypothetical protein
MLKIMISPKLECLPTKQQFLIGTKSRSPFVLFTWMSHGDWLLFGFIVIDDYSNCIVESSP